MNKTHYPIREFCDKFPELANIRGVVSTRLGNLAHYGLIERKAIKDATAKAKWEYKKEDIITAIRHYYPDFLTAPQATSAPQSVTKIERKTDLNKGDIVTLKAVIKYVHVDAYDVNILRSDKSLDTSVTVSHDSVKLDTAYKDRLPYSVSESRAQWNVKRNDDVIVAGFIKKVNPHAEAAAINHCNYLNHIWQQENPF